MRIAIVAAAAAVLSGCAGDTPPPPSPRLAPPSALLTADCGLLPPIPADDGDPSVRRRYYSATRAAFVTCRERHRGMVAYVAAIRK